MTIRGLIIAEMGSGFEGLTLLRNEFFYSWSDNNEPNNLIFLVSADNLCHFCNTWNQNAPPQFIRIDFKGGVK